MTPELIALLIAVVAGAALTLAFDRNARGSRVAGEAILLGIGACAAVLFLLTMIGIAWTRVSFGVAIAIVVLSVLPSAARNLRRSAGDSSAQPLLLMTRAPHPAFGHLLPPGEGTEVHDLQIPLPLGEGGRRPGEGRASLKSRSAIADTCVRMTCCFVIAFVTSLAHAHDWTPVAEALGRAGSVQPGVVYKVSFPRSDLDVVAAGVHVKPALALGSWAAFFESGMAMGDLVLLESEVNDVIDALQAGGIEQSALHNHLIGEQPHVMYVHFIGHGDVVKLARTLRGALEKTKTPMAPPAPPPSTSVDLPTADLDRILGASGKAAGGVWQFAIPRLKAVTAHGMEIPPAAGVATAINFQPTGDGRAAISGDFVMIASEVNPVIRALRHGNINITALHSHMLDESPRLFFMHFWANDDAVALAKTLRAALEKMAVKR
jgi:hypothetical protein